MPINRSLPKSGGGFLAVGFLLGWIAHGLPAANAQAIKPFVVTHIYTGTDGQTKVEPFSVAMTRSTAPRDSGILDSVSAVPARQVQIVRTSPDYLDNFHTVATRRYVVMLRGHREYEVSGGQRFSAGPGSIMLVEDLTGSGHLTRGAEDEAVSMVVILDDSK